MKQDHWQEQLAEIINKRCNHPRYPSGCEECNYLFDLVRDFIIELRQPADNEEQCDICGFEDEKGK